MKKVLLLFFIVVCLVLAWLNYRSFYTIHNTTFTVWKRWGGYCYITPYPYFGIKPPKDDFVKIPNVSSITICIKEDSLIIFDEDFSQCAEGDSLYVSFTRYNYRYIQSDNFEYIIEMRKGYLRKYPFLTTPD